ncbi:carbon monoxide dehydrogenase [Variovorax paradoxus]|uniref:Carbon monoxide dehydrogenase n=1 Tax=Variovorax paradoxus TaxID=34073 RepID=A0A5Q0M6B6_VARPD|nr:carbon monoxide dehydrogenase subunit G [Variovorax paradoxus]QFZ85191.1 carbon monoxide dehydrogenase [Variovorax paradoxus]
MEIQGEKLLSVPRSEVWHALNDPKVLQRCVPGCDTFEPEGENKFRVAMQAAVGPVRARFSGKLQLRDVIAPTSYALAFEGSGGVAGFGKGTAEVSLEDADGGTRLRYIAQAQVGGRLAQVGARLIDGVTKRMADDFFTRFVKELTHKDAAEEAAQSVATSHGTTSTVRAPAISPGFPSTSSYPPAPSSTSTQIAVVAAAVSATAAAIAVLATVFVLQIGR